MNISILSISEKKYIIDKDFGLKIKITHKPTPHRITVTIPLPFTKDKSIQQIFIKNLQSTRPCTMRGLSPGSGQ